MIEVTYRKFGYDYYKFTVTSNEGGQYHQNVHRESDAQLWQIAMWLRPRIKALNSALNFIYANEGVTFRFGNDWLYFLDNTPLTDLEEVMA